MQVRTNNPVVESKEEAVFPLLDEETRHDITCPITMEVYYDPVSVNGCGHVFERDAMKSLARCPNCREPVTGLTPSLPTKNLVERTLKNYPALGDERYFKISNLIDASRKKNTAELNRLAVVLASSAKHLNAMSEEPGHEGTSALIELSSSSQGLLTLQRNPALRKNIMEEGFNTILKTGPWSGASAAAFMLSHPIGRPILAEDAELRAKISSKSLNSVREEGPYCGVSAVCALACGPAGRALLIQDKELRAKITPEGLNGVFLEGPHYGTSAILMLACHIEAQVMLLEDDELRAKITGNGLNNYCYEAGDCGTSVLFWLTTTPVGRAILLKDKRLASLINISPLMQIIPDGAHKGESAYQHLYATPEGQEILRSLSPGLQAEIQQWLRPRQTKRTLFEELDAEEKTSCPVPPANELAESPSTTMTVVSNGRSSSSGLFGTPERGRPAGQLPQQPGAPKRLRR